VKAERFRLPDQVLELAVGLPWCGRRRERALGPPQVSEVFGRAPVRERIGGAAVAARAVAGGCQPEASRLQALRRVEDEGAERLSWGVGTYRNWS
jgi:hypothetical protein